MLKPTFLGESSQRLVVPTPDDREAEVDTDGATCSATR